MNLKTRLFIHCSQIIQFLSLNIFFTILSQQNILSMIQNILSMIQNMYYYCSLCQDGNILLALQ